MSRFSDYIQKTFHFSPREVEEVIDAMKKPLKKSIRLNTRKIALKDFKLHAQEQGWTLTGTDIPEVFLIDRDDTSIALGNTIEHQAGWFYIQEVAAAEPPYLLKKEIGKWQEDKGKTHDYNNSVVLPLSFPSSLILDMCAAPGGKTTQLADYFPESLIIANEVNRTRTPQLFENLDRMGYDNIVVVSCDGRFFQNFPDFFDAVLLDAPCSGEGTAFRDNSIIDHWHEKNIDRIAKLQKQLMETAVTVTKPGGFLSYSTCTLNKEENENVIYSISGKDSFESDNQKQEAQDGTFGKLEQKYCKRFWPHIERTGGFFASIFEKKGVSAEVHDYPVLAAQGQKNLIVTPATRGEKEIVERFILKHLGTKLKNGFLYLIKDGVYFNQRNLGPLSQYFFFVHAGTRIGRIKKNIFTPTCHLFWCIQDTSSLPRLEITPTLWSEILAKKSAKVEREDGHYAVLYFGRDIGIGEVKKGEYLGI